MYKKINRNKKIISSESESLKSESSQSKENTDSENESIVTSSTDSEAEIHENVKISENLINSSEADSPKPINVRKNKKKNEKYDKSAYTYETIIGVHLYNTSDLKFKKYIRSPRIKVSVFDIKTRLFLLKSNRTRNVVLNYEPENVDYFLPIISKDGTISKSGSFSFCFDETLIFNDDIRHIKNENVVITFEIIDTIVSSTKKKLKKSDGWHYISWAFLKPCWDEICYINCRINLQLYKYKKIRKKFDIIEQYFDENRIKYPAKLEVSVQEIKFHEEEVALGRPHTALQKDKYGSDSQGKLSLQTVNSARDSKAVTIPSIAKLKKIFQRNKFECPNQRVISKRLSKKCSVVKFSPDGECIAYTQLDKNNADIIIATVPGLKLLHLLKGHSGLIHSVEWLHRHEALQHRILISTSDDHTCIVWHLNEGSYSMDVLPHSSFVYSAEFLQVKEKFFGIASGGRDGILYIWKVDKKAGNAQLQQEISKHEFYIVGITYASTHSKIFTADVGAILLEWLHDKWNDVWKNSRSFTIPRGVRRIQLIERLNILYAATKDSLCKVDVRSGLQRKQFLQSVPSSKGFNFIATPCGNSIFSSSHSNKITCTNFLRSDSPPETITIPEMTNISIRSIDFCATRNLLALSLSSKLTGNYFMMFGSNVVVCNDIENIETSETNAEQTDRIEPIKRIGLPSDCRNNSRLGSFFNEVLDKCDRIIRFGVNGKDKFKTDSNAIVIPEIDSGNSMKSDKTFTVSEKSEKIGNATFSIERKDLNNEVNNTFTIGSGGNVAAGDDETDISETLDSTE